MIKHIQVYDPPMCCSTGICGPEIDPALVKFAALLAHFAESGIIVDRYNLGQRPMAFVENPKVKALLDQDGMDVLPLVFWDGELKSQGRYPDDDERVAWGREALSSEPAATV
jgi:hypothetical protein